jgi:hypothetical protein
MMGNVTPGANFLARAAADWCHDLDGHKLGAFCMS